MAGREMKQLVKNRKPMKMNKGCDVDCSAQMPLLQNGMKNSAQVHLQVCWVEAHCRPCRLSPL